MAQKLYQKASVQVAIITGLTSLIVAGGWILHERSELKRENKSLLTLTHEQTAEIQELQTLLTPFRTIALQRFSGPEGEALEQLAERIKIIDASLAIANNELENTKKELEATKKELQRKTSDRSLNEKQKEELKSSLIGVSGKIIIKGDVFDPEAQIFANQIKE